MPLGLQYLDGRGDEKAAAALIDQARALGRKVAE